MISQDNVGLIPFKSLLFLIAGIFAVAATLLVIFLSSAATVTGKTPASAVTLVSGLNTGVLGPGEQRWFKLSPQPQAADRRVEKSLTLFFAPGDGNRLRNVSLQLFDRSQLPLFSRGDASQMTNFGAGQSVSRDNNPQTGELFWTGWLFSQDSYYIQIVNNNDTVIDYWLFDDDIYDAELDSEKPPVPTPVFAGGAAPQTATPLQSGVNSGGLDPGDEVWYSFRLADFDDDYFEEMALTMVATPDDGQRIHYLTFDIFTAEAVRDWSPGNSSHLKNLGAGSIVVRDDNGLTGERFWNGWVIDKALYYVQIRNGADAHMDYWLFTGDVYRPELGGEPALITSR